MENILCLEDFNKLNENKLCGSLPASFVNSKIFFSGKNNILFCEENVNLINCTISFGGSNSVVFLSSNPRHKYQLKIDIFNNSTAFFGRNIFFNGLFSVSVSESKNLIVGNDCVFSFGIWIRTSDAHLIYNCKTMKRRNLSKSVLIGDHVWLGQNALLLKGTVIGSGSIVAANSVVSGKKIHSNSSWGGNPATFISDDVFWDGRCVHSWDEQKTKNNMIYSDRQYIFEENDFNIDMNKLDQKLLSIEDVSGKLNYIVDNLIPENKNRFFIRKPVEKKSVWKFKK